VKEITAGVETEVGLMIKLWESTEKTSKLSLRPELKLRWSDPGSANLSDFFYMLGVQYSFGGSPVALPVAAEPPPPSDEDRRLASGFEASVERIALMLRSGIHDNQIVAIRKTNPDRAAHLADLLGLMAKDLRRIEVALREMAVQASFLGV